MDIFMFYKLYKWYQIVRPTTYKQPKIIYENSGFKQL